MDSVKEKWLQEIQVEDLPLAYQEIAKIAGKDAAIALGRIYQGTTYYWPKLDDAILAARNRRILSEHRNGMDIRRLAMKYELTEMRIRQILEEHNVDKDQITMFDEVVEG